MTRAAYAKTPIMSRSTPIPTRCRIRKTPKMRNLCEAVYTELESVLSELYDSHQMRLVVEFGRCFYGVQDSLSTYRKRFSLHHYKKRGKQPCKKSYNGRIATTHILPPEDFFFHNPPLGPPWYPTRYKYQETILYTIDVYLDSSLGPKCRRKSTTLEPPGRPELFRQQYTWETLSELCDGANLLVNLRGYGKARALLDRFFDGLNHVCILEDLSTISIFWRICLQLRGIEHRWQNFTPLHQFFFEKVKALIFNQGGKETHPLFVVSSSMRKVSDEDFKDTLRICFFKTVDTLLALFGDNHPTVLQLLSLYYRHFHWGCEVDTKKQNLVQKLRTIRNQVQYTDHGHGDENEIIIADYNIAYAAHHICGYHEVARHHAERIHKRTRDMPFDDETPWTPAARAFVFAVNVLSAHYHLSKDFNTARRILEHGIEKLETGGNDHRVRACKLSSTLVMYFKKRKCSKEAQLEEARGKRLLNELYGHQLCLRCFQSQHKKKFKICVRCYMDQNNPSKPRKKRYRAFKFGDLHAQEVRRNRRKSI